MRIALPPAIAPDAFAGHDPAAPVVTLDGETMGTTWTVKLARTAGIDPAAVLGLIVERLDALVAEMSHWAADSQLARFNRAPSGRWMALSPDFARVIAAGLAIAAASGGAFDPAIGGIVNLWGFGPEPAVLPPDAVVLERARERSGWDRLAYDPAARRLRQPGGLALDLSGIAKGYAVDAIAALLANAGVRHCLVEIGGELAGRGMRPDGDPWWVDLETPPGIALPPLRIALHALAVATTGDYRRGSHTIDPRTGAPAMHGLASASVIHASAMAADAWATALTVLGPEAGVAMAEREGLAAQLVVREGDAVREILTPALRAMLAD